MKQPSRWGLRNALLALVTSVGVLVVGCADWGVSDAPEPGDESSSAEAAGPTEEQGGLESRFGQSRFGRSRFGQRSDDLLSGRMPYRGVNLAGAEFGVDQDGVGALPGSFGSNYTYPSAQSGTYFLDQGMTTLRIPFRWERLQPTERGALNGAELARLSGLVNGLTAQGAQVVLDPHNYARYYGNVIGAGSVSNADFADFWQRLANTFRSNTDVIFSLMNEPKEMPTEQWLSAANAAIAAIRGTGAMNLILVSGNGWTGAHSWNQDWYGTPNGVVMGGVVDPGNNFAYEVHQYFDSDSSGTSGSCVSPATVTSRLAEFTNWCKGRGCQGFLGEFGGGNNAGCQAAVDAALDHLEANTDVYIGWTWWAAGPWWGDYFLSIEPPRNGAGQPTGHKPQMAWLTPHLSGPECSVDADCSDGNACTDDVCNAGVCESNANTAPCDDGNACTQGDTCSAGVCSGSALDCDDGDACTTDVCNAGQCEHQGGCGSCEPTVFEAEAMQHSTGGAVTDGWNIWSNGNISTTHVFEPGTTTLVVTARGEFGGGGWPNLLLRVGSTLVGSQVVNSADWAPYSFEYDAPGGAQTVSIEFNNDSCCDSGDRNLVVDRMVVHCAAECTIDADCEDGNECTDDVCVAGECTSSHNAASCDDGDACTVSDSCVAGACQGAALDCGDDLACTVDACSDGACTHDASACECLADADCDDGIPCTAEQCVAGECATDASACECLADADCDDGVACTADACVEQMCAHDAAPCGCLQDSDCDDGNPCTDSTCDAGSCVHENNSAACDDGDACTESDTCSQGSCIGTAISCSDGIECTTDACSAGVCEHDASACECLADADCDDGVDCTVEACVGQVCEHDASACECLADADCDDDNECTDELCENNECTVSNNTASCDDGDGCTVGDACSGGGCQGNAQCNAACGACPDGESCVADADCQSGSCNANVCGAPPSGCTEATAVDLGARGIPKTVANNQCLKVTAYPVWWGNNRGLLLQTLAGGSYPVPFTWSQSCSGRSGAATLVRPWQSLLMGNVDDDCATLLQLNGSGGNITLRWF